MIAGFLVLSDATKIARGDLTADPCLPVLDVGVVEAFWTAAMAAGASSDDDGGLADSDAVEASEIESSGGNWSANARVVGSSSTVESRAEFHLMWVNAHAIRTFVHSRVTSSTTHATVSGSGQAGVRIPIRVMPGQSSATTATIRVIRSRHVLGVSGVSGTGTVDGIVRDIAAAEYRTTTIDEYTVAVGDWLPLTEMSGGINVAGAGDMIAEVTLTVELVASNDCCGDPCCGDPCCGDACCGDPCCGDPCCGDPCCLDPCCDDPNECCGSDNQCCGQDDPCCDDDAPCCGNPDPCCDPHGPCCGVSDDPCCDSDDPCCNNPNECCGEDDPCCESDAPCCGNPDPCCDPQGPCCGISSDPCCLNDDPCCNDPDQCCGNEDPCCDVDCDDDDACTSDGCLEGDCSNVPITCQED